MAKITIRRKTSGAYAEMYPKTDISQVENFRVSMDVVESGTALFSGIGNCENDTDVNVELNIADNVRTIDLQQTTERRFVYAQLVNATADAITVEPVTALPGVEIRAVATVFDIPAGGCLEVSYIRRGNVITFLSTQNMEAL